MANGRTLAVVVLLGTVAGALLWRRRRAGRKERVDLYFADGSMVSLEQGGLDADQLLPLARGVLAAARGTR